MKNAEIIIVKYKNPRVELKCLDKVIKHTKIGYSLTLFDNALHNENIGKLWNRLIKQSQHRYICLLNSDAYVTSDGWLEKLIEPFDREFNCAVVGPTTNNCKNHQNSSPPSKEYDVVNFSMNFPGECLSGFCMVLDRNAVLDVGGFPEDCGFYGQEVILLDKMYKMNYQQYWRKDVYVEHEGSASVKEAQKRGEIDEEKERSISRILINKFRSIL